MDPCAIKELHSTGALSTIPPISCTNFGSNMDTYCNDRPFLIKISNIGEYRFVPHQSALSKIYQCRYIKLWVLIELHSRIVNSLMLSLLTAVTLHCWMLSA